MSFSERLSRLARLLKPSTWKFLLLVATDPNLDNFYRFWSKTPADFSDNPEPFFTLDATRFVDEHFSEGMKGLEWGSGFSSLWFTQQGCKMTSIEHNEEWYALIQQKLTASSTVKHYDLDDGYADPVADMGDYDFFVIDGRKRSLCAENVHRHLKNRQEKTPVWVIFDDAQRDRYRDALEPLKELCDDIYVFSQTNCEVLDKITLILRY